MNHTKPNRSPGNLPDLWRQRAEFLSEYGDPNVARLWLIAATELEQAQLTQGEETMTLVEAARLSGYSADHLGSLIRSGKIPNYGRRNAPRIRRCDLPTKHSTKPGRPPSRKAAKAEDITNIAKKLR